MRAWSLSRIASASCRVAHDLLPGGVRPRARSSRYRFCATRCAWPSCASVWLSSEPDTSRNSTNATAIIGITTMTTKKSRRRFLKLGVKSWRTRMATVLRRSAI